jgi:hypothetical protein
MREGEGCGVDYEPLATLAARQILQHAPFPMSIDAYHPPFPTMMPHQIQPGMMVNLHLTNAMPPLPMLPPNAQGGPRHKGHKKYHA